MSLEIDKEWMQEVDIISPRYLGGVAYFLDFVVKYGGGFDKYLCPCSLCQNVKGMVDLPTITYDLLNNGIDQSYIFWKYHGEKDLVKDIDKSAAKSNGQNDDQNNHPRMEDLVNDAFEMHRSEGVDPLCDVTMRECDDDDSSKVHVDHVPDGGKKYNSLLAHAKEPLYSYCPEGITTLYAVKKYDLPEISRDPMEFKMSVSFKKNKYKLRCENYKTKRTQEERKKNVPKNCREEDWLAFCANENIERAEIMSKQNKKNREMLTCPHVTGRICHAQIEAEMRAELDDPMEDIPRHETWVKVRTRKDGTILASALPFVEKINEILKTQDESSKGSQSLDNDVLAQALEKDESRGRVRGKSGTSKTKLKTTQSLHAKLVACRAENNNLKTHLNESRQQINNLGSRCNRFESFMDEMRGRSPTEVVSHSPSQGFSTGTTQTAFEHHTNVAIMNMAQQVVAYGIVVKDGTSGILHGRHLKDFEVKVLLDKIILQDEKLYPGTQGFADTYAEVGTCGFVVHHRDFLKRT